jgi:hypothetical protein
MTKWDIKICGSKFKVLLLNDIDIINLVKILHIRMKLKKIKKLKIQIKKIVVQKFNWLLDHKSFNRLFKKYS